MSLAASMQSLVLSIVMQVKSVAEVLTTLSPLLSAASLARRSVFLHFLLSRATHVTVLASVRVKAELLPFISTGLLFVVS